MARSPSNPQLVLRPQDLVVLLRLALDQAPAPTYAALGAELGITASEAHAAVERAVAARLAIRNSDGKPQVLRSSLRQFLQHGARYCFPASQGGLTRGVPTGYAASPLKEQIRLGNDPPPVWPSKNGTARVPGVNYVGGSRQLRRRVGPPPPGPGRGGGRADGRGRLAGN